MSAHWQGLFGVLVVLTVLGGAAPARADWYALRNDTPEVVLVQEVIQVRDEARRVNPKRLFPGESAREMLFRPAQKHILIFSVSHPDRPVFDGELRCGTAGAVFSIRPAGPGRVSVAEVSAEVARTEK